MRRFLQVALIVLPLFLSPAWAAPGHSNELVKAIRYLGSDHPPINVVSPTHVPVPASSEKIGPGAYLLIDRPDGSFLCTANFVWVSGDRLFLGAAGHCFVPQDKVSTHGPGANYDPSHTSVEVCISNCEFGGQMGAIFGDFIKLGPVVYARQTKNDVDVGNDFGIVEIPSSVSRDLINASMPVWGGPSGIEEVSTGVGVCLYGNGTVTGETFVTKARTGFGQGLFESGRGWAALIPSTPGDSGSAIVTCGKDSDGYHGRGAAGILTHFGVSEYVGVFGTTMGRAVEMTLQDTGIWIHPMLQDGTTADPPAPPPEPPPPPPLAPTESYQSIGMMEEYRWDAGPFTRVATTGLLGEPCSGAGEASDHCDYEWLRVNVPNPGARLVVHIQSEDPTADFDLYVFGPDGTLVGDSAHEANPETVDEIVNASGVYTIAVNPYAVVNAKYHGSASLKELPPPPADLFDGDVSLGGSYTWKGDPLLDANPVFTCAPLVAAFCDSELIKLNNVPEGGATLIVDIKADTAGDDFDVCLYTPTGTQTCFSEEGDDHAVLQVTQSGVYRVGVKAFFAPLGTYTGTASLN